MVQKNFRGWDSDECHSNGLRDPLGARLSRSSQLLKTRNAVTTIDNSERELVLKKAFLGTLLKLIVNTDSTEPSGRRVGRSHQPSTVPVLF